MIYRLLPYLAIGGLALTLFFQIKTNGKLEVEKAHVKTALTEVSKSYANYHKKTQADQTLLAESRTEIQEISRRAANLQTQLAQSGGCASQPIDADVRQRLLDFRNHQN